MAALLWKIRGTWGVICNLLKEHVPILPRNLPKNPTSPFPPPSLNGFCGTVESVFRAKIHSVTERSFHLVKVPDLPHPPPVGLGSLYPGYIKMRVKFRNHVQSNQRRVYKQFIWQIGTQVHVLSGKKFLTLKRLGSQAISFVQTSLRHINSSREFRSIWTNS